MIDKETINDYLKGMKPALLNFCGCVNDIKSIDNNNYSYGDIVVTSDNYTYVKVDDGEDGKWIPISTATSNFIGTRAEWDSLSQAEKNMYSTVLWDDDCSFSDNYNPTIELIETKCFSCGAPLKIRSRYDITVKCEYCGMTYGFESRRN